MSERRIKQRIVQLLQAGRFGRACRTFHRWKHTAPRLLKDPKKRADWIRNPRW